MAVIGDIHACIEYLKERVDIIDVVGEAVHLQSAGGDMHKGLCCFHDEKSPSLTVTRSKKFYHCFGCKESGDIISFYKKHYGYNTVESIYMIAQKYNIDISNFERELTPEEKRRNKLLSINKKLAEGLHAILMEKGNRGYTYLTEERGLDDKDMDDYQLGYCRNLTDVYSILKDEAPEDITLLQLDNSMMFTDSIVYPLIQPNGDVIGFKTRPYYEGRTVDSHGRKLAKYVGTSNQSPVYTTDFIYGFNLARKAVKDGKLTVVEGQHDAIACRKYGVENVGASDGTALTQGKLEMLEEYGIREIVLLFDGDQAGRESSLKLAKESQQLNSSISIKIAIMDSGYDPDSFLSEKGKLQLLMIVSNAVYSNQYVIDRIYDSIPTGNVTGKIDFIKAVQGIIMESQPHEEIFLIQHVAEKIDILPHIIEDMIREEKAKKSKSLLYNLNGEIVVLGGMMRDVEFRLEALTEIKHDDWYVYKNQVLFDMIYEMENSNVDINLDTLKATMNNLGHNQLFNDGSGIEEVYATTGDYRTLLSDILDKSHRRKLIKKAQDLEKTAKNFKNNIPMVIEEHIDSVVDVVDNEVSEGKATPQDGAKNFMNVLVDRMKNPNQIVGLELKSRFPNVTSILNGIQKKKLITISANQSVGKTTLLCNWLEDIAITQKKKWVHFTLEMPKEEVVTKIIGIRAGVNSQQIERGNLTAEEFRKVQQATIDYHEGGLIVYDDKVTLESIVNEIRVLQRREDIAGVSIDYVQLMMIERSKNKQRYEELGDISGALKNDVAKKMNIPVIILSQLGRSAIQAEVATAEHGSGSYKIAQDSDIYITLKEKSADEIAEWGIEKGNLIMNVDKNRGGQADKLLDIIFQKDLQIMQEVA